MFVLKLNDKNLTGKKTKVFLHISWEMWWLEVTLCWYTSGWYLDTQVDRSWSDFDDLMLGRWTMKPLYLRSLGYGYAAESYKAVYLEMLSMVCCMNRQDNMCCLLCSLITILLIDWLIWFCFFLFSSGRIQRTMGQYRDHCYRNCWPCMVRSICNKKEHPVITPFLFSFTSSSCSFELFAQSRSNSP